MTRLKPCPFCGGYAIATPTIVTYKTTRRSHVRCSICGVKTIHKNIGDAIDHWNRRTA